MTEAIPEGFRTITPHITVDGGEEAIEFYKRAFGAVEVVKLPGQDGSIMHAELRIGDSMIMLHDELPDMGRKGPKALGGTAVSIHMYVENADDLFERAVDAGATVIMRMEDTFWGDRYGVVEDPFGHRWAIATHLEDLTPEQIMEKAKAAFAG